MLTIEQKALRKKGIGASDSSTLFMLNDWSTPYRLWYEKTGRADNEVEEKNDAMWWGTHLEETILKRFEHETGKTVVRDGETKFSDLSPYMMCHLDGIVPEDNFLLEAKIARYNPQHWGASGTSEIPPKYQIQIQHQLACNPGYAGSYLCVFFYQTLTMQIYKIMRNDELISKIANSVNRFWLEHVVLDVAPDLYTVDDVRLAYPIDNREFLEASPLELESHEKLKIVKEKMKALADEEKKYKTDLIILTGANSGIKSNGQIICTYKANKNGVRSFNLS